VEVVAAPALIRSLIGIALVAGLVGCGGSGLEGTLDWAQPPAVSGRSVKGSIENKTSHSVSLDAGSMRLLDDRGRKVAGRIRVASSQLASGAATSLTARWKSGDPVRIDYGAGTLALPSD
jgi:hypothetical protein